MATDTTYTLDQFLADTRATIIHSIEFGDDTFFLRVTGGDVETKETLRFDVANKTVEVANRSQGQR